MPTALYLFCRLYVEDDAMVYVNVSTDKINIDDVIAKVSDPGHGAIDIFIGAVRNNHNGKIVTGITYDAHDNLAEKSFRDICDEAAGIWPGTNYAVVHFKGELPVGGVSIVIAVSSQHRAESFDACRYVIEEIKKQAPIWKREHYLDGKSDWLPGHSLRQAAEYTITCCGKCQEHCHG
jgi:molybdopterin synthase catalytic subunit